MPCTVTWQKGVFRLIDLTLAYLPLINNKRRILLVKTVAKPLNKCQTSIFLSLTMCINDAFLLVKTVGQPLNRWQTSIFLSLTMCINDAFLLVKTVGQSLNRCQTGIFLSLTTCIHFAFLLVKIVGQAKQVGITLLIYLI